MWETLFTLASVNVCECARAHAHVWICVRVTLLRVGVKSWWPASPHSLILSSCSAGVRRDKYQLPYPLCIRYQYQRVVVAAVVVMMDDDNATCEQAAVSACAQACGEHAGKP